MVSYNFGSMGTLFLASLSGARPWFTERPTRAAGGRPAVFSPLSLFLAPGSCALEAAGPRGAPVKPHFLSFQ